MSDSSRSQKHKFWENDPETTEDFDHLASLTKHYKAELNASAPPGFSKATTPTKDAPGFSIFNKSQTKWNGTKMKSRAAKKPKTRQQIRPIFDFFPIKKQVPSLPENLNSAVSKKRKSNPSSTFIPIRPKQIDQSWATPAIMGDDESSKRVVQLMDPGSSKDVSIEPEVILSSDDDDEDPSLPAGKPHVPLG